MTNEGRNNVLRVGLLEDVHQLNPFSAVDYGTWLVLSQIFEPLFSQESAQDVPSPLLGRSALEKARDSRGFVYRAALREDACFSDGKAVSIQAVIDSLQHSPRIRDACKMEEEGGRIVFISPRPLPWLEAELSRRWSIIAEPRGGDFIGTGPYRMEKGVDGSLRLLRNEYYPQAPSIGSIEFHAFPPEQSGGKQGLRRAVEEGDVDFTTLLCRSEIAGLSGVRKLYQPGASTCFLFFNSQSDIFSDRAVREMLSLCIDSVEVTAQSYDSPQAFAARSLLPPCMDFKALGGSRQRLQRAQQLYGQLESKLGRTLKLISVWTSRPYLPDPRASGEVIVRQIEALGLSVELHESRSLEEYLSWIDEGDYDLVIGGWAAESPAPADFLEAILGSENIPQSGVNNSSACNFSRWASAATDQALEDFRNDSSERGMQALSDLLQQEIPLIPLMYGSSIVAHGWNLKGFELNPTCVPNFSKLQITPSKSS